MWATNEIQRHSHEAVPFLFPIESNRCYNSNIMTSKAKGSNLQSTLTALQGLSPADRQAIM